MRDIEKNIIDLYGEEGRKWLANLPLLIAQLEKAHGLSGLKPFKNLSYNYVLSGFKGTMPVVLKLSLDSDSLQKEVLVLQAFAGCGIVKIVSEKEGMLLLDRAVSGVSLKSYFPELDREAVFILCDCLNKLHQATIPENHQFPHINDWLMALDQELAIPIPFLSKARKLRNDLLSTPSPPVLLHGDLHHDNILQNDDDWLVIDPKGVIGEAAYEVAAFIRNPIPQLLECHDALTIIDRRIQCFADELKLPEQRIRDWCYVQAVLAWVWALEDGIDIAYFKKLTELFF